MKFFILLLLSINIFSNVKVEKINLYLKWKHGFQFAGYYAAVKKGYYKDANIEINFLENIRYKKDKIDEILNTPGNYGIETPKLLLDKEHRNKMKIISVIFQHSPIVAIVLESSGIKTPQQFSGKRILSDSMSSELRAMLIQEGVNLDNLIFIKRNRKGEEKFKNKEVDIILGYVTTLPYQLKKEDLKINLIRPIDYGVDFYGDFIFTSNIEIKNHSERVDRFLKASLKGWEFAMTHKEEIIKYILENYKTDYSYEQLLYEANSLEKNVMMSKFIEIGHMNIGRWKTIEKTFKKLNLVDKDFNINNFIYSKKEKSIWNNKYFKYSLYTILIITAMFLILFLFNLRLKEEVKNRIKEINEKDSKFKAIFNNNFQFSGILDLDGRVLLVNKSALEIINKNEEDVIKKYLWETPWFEDSKEEIDKIKKSINDRKFIRFEITSKGANGKIFTIDFSIKFIENNEFASSFYIVEGRDITNYKNIHKKINNSQKMEAIGVLAGGISHDFNNIISSILGYTELIKMNLADNDLNLKNINQIVEASKRAKKLVTRIIAFSRGVEEDKKHINIIILIEEIIKLIRPTIKSDKVTINFKAKNNASIYAVYTQIEQVIMNILRNALQSIENEGKIDIIVDIFENKQEQILFDSILPIGNYLKLSIIDTGKGIEQKNIERIFEPYFSTKHKKDGTGLGLFVVHGIINKHNSYIDVSSTVNIGTKINLFFPTTSESFDNIKTDDRKYLSSQSMLGKHILFLDDEEMISDSMGKILTKKGFIVDVFTSPIDAYNSFNKNLKYYDIIITDQSMPEMTGTEFVSKIKKIRSDIPIILCSGYNNTINKTNISEYGINEYLEKPIMVNELIIVVNHLLSIYNNG